MGEMLVQGQVEDNRWAGSLGFMFHVSGAKHSSVSEQANGSFMFLFSSGKSCACGVLTFLHLAGAICRDHNQRLDRRERARSYRPEGLSRTESELFLVHSQNLGDHDKAVPLWGHRDQRYYQFGHDDLVSWSSANLSGLFGLCDFNPCDNCVDCAWQMGF